MPRIHHVALWAADLDAVCGFYARWFGAEVGAPYHNPAKGFRSRFVSFGEGGRDGRIEVMASTSLDLSSRAPGAQGLGWTHLALALGSEAAVDDLAARMRAVGVPLLDGPRRTGDGFYECVVLDPEGNRVEISA